jgi:hypothetical protein
LIIGVEGGFEEKDCGDAAGDVHYFARFVGGQGAAQEFVLAIAEPFLDHLIAANGVIPNPRRNVSPIGHIVQINVTSSLAEMFSKRVLSSQTTKGRLAGGLFVSQWKNN